MLREFELKKLALSKKFRQAILDVKQQREQYILKENGEPQAGLLSIDDFALLEKAKADKDKIWNDLLGNLKTVHESNMHYSADEIDADVDQAIDEVRQAKKA